MKASLLLFVMIVATVSVSAQLDGNPPNMCRNGFFPRESESYSVGTIEAGKRQRVYFFGDDGDCPNGKGCRSRKYLIGGNQVIVSRNFGEWSCVWYQPVKGAETVGWIETSKIKFSEDKIDVSPAAWIGEWTYYDSTIRIGQASAKDRFKLTGNAFWRGLGDNIHIGELDGEAKLESGSLDYGYDAESEYDCRVRLRLVPGYLIVSDNLNCGGANVTFSGVYRRKKK